MPSCCQPEIGSMLPAYEMGILTGDDLILFEEHLYVCDHCLLQVQKSDSIAGHMLNSDKIQSEVFETVSDSSGQESRRHSFPGTEKKRWRKASIPLFAVLLLLLILGPWNIEIETSREAIALDNRIVIGCFENLADENTNLRLGEVVSNLLITDLSESQFIQVVPSSRLKSLLHASGESDYCSADQGNLWNAAQSSGSRWVLSGTVFNEDGRPGLTSQIIDITTGATQSSQKVLGNSSDDIFALVDQLTRQIKKDIALPEEAFEEDDRLIAEVTTHSTQAYNYYLDGLAFVEQQYFEDAARAFENALLHDSTFAMAYYYLCQLKDTRLINRAVHYSEDATWKERLYIQSVRHEYSNQIDSAILTLDKIIDRYPDEKTAQLMLGNISYQLGSNDDAIKHYSLALEIDPFYKSALNQLSITYGLVNDFENAILTANRYIQTAPHEASPYAAKGKLYADFGEIDPAIEAFEKALEKKKDFPESLKMLGILYSFKREFIKSDSSFERVIQTSAFNRRSWVRLYQATMLTRQGRLDSALTIIEKLIHLGEIEKASTHFMIEARLSRAMILRTQRNYTDAVIEIDSAIQRMLRDTPDYPPNYLRYFVQLLAEDGKLDQADSILNVLYQQVEQYPSLWFVYCYGKGCINMQLENYTAAVDNFREAAKLRPRNNNYGYFETHTMLAQALLRNGNIEEAILEYNNLQTPYNYFRAYWSLWDVTSHYYLGLAYEKSGWINRAVHEYEMLLDYWQDGDINIVERQEVERRLAALRQKT